MTVGDDYCSSAVEYCILGMVLHIRLQLCLKFPQIRTVRHDIKWHNVHMHKAMHLWYIHMNHQKPPFYAILEPGVQVLLHGTDRQKVLAKDSLDYTGLSLE